MYNPLRRRKTKDHWIICGHGAGQVFLLNLWTGIHIISTISCMSINKFCLKIFWVMDKETYSLFIGLFIRNVQRKSFARLCLNQSETSVCQLGALYINPQLNYIISHCLALYYIVSTHWHINTTAVFRQVRVVQWGINWVTWGGTPTSGLRQYSQGSLQTFLVWTHILKTVWKNSLRSVMWKSLPILIVSRPFQSLAWQQLLGDKPWLYS